VLFPDLIPILFGLSIKPAMRPGPLKSFFYEWDEDGIPVTGGIIIFLRLSFD